MAAIGRLFSKRVIFCWALMDIKEALLFSIQLGVYGGDIKSDSQEVQMIQAPAEFGS